jgi:hypothetical protein
MLAAKLAVDEDEASELLDEVAGAETATGGALGARAEDDPAATEAPAILLTADIALDDDDIPDVGFSRGFTLAAEVVIRREVLWSRGISFLTRGDDRIP